VWVNTDLFPHTATASAQAFDSHDIASQKSWTYIADAVGEFQYYCIYHPTMKATLIVH
jgi:plastocyanin